MILLDARPPAVCRELDAVNDRIILLLLRNQGALHDVATKFVGRWIFYRGLCELQQQTIAEERRQNARQRETIRQLRETVRQRDEEIACRSGVPKERP